MPVDRTEALALYDLSLSELSARADRVRRECAGDELAVCAIVNAKSGACGEDCRFCAQSAHSRTGVAEYPLMDLAGLLEGARRAKRTGAGHFGIVTSGKRLNAAETGLVAEAVAAIRREVGIEVCASLGCLAREDFMRLASAGLSRFNHNIETSPGFFASVVSSHTFEDRVATIRNAAAEGISVCCGGIIGMGETRADRVDMALALRELDVDSVPINVLMGVPGTPFAETPRIGASEIIKTIAIFRLVMPGKTIKLAAGREEGLGDFEGMAFMSGANGMIIGDYLTQPGRRIEKDERLIRDVKRAWTE